MTVVPLASSRDGAKQRAYRERVRAQTLSWAQGRPYHNRIDDECCPDFSCCQPELLEKDDAKRWEAYSKEGQSLTVEHVMVLEINRPFIVFNDDGTLTMEPVSVEELEPIEASDNFGASCAWSANCRFYFVVLPIGIVLLDLEGRGWLCRKRSAMFFDLFVNSPLGKKRARR